MSKVKIPESEYNKIVDMYLNGLTHKEISDKYGVTSLAIGYILKKCSIICKNRTYKLNADDFDKIVKMYTNKYSVKDISKIFNITQTRVRQILHDNGIDTPNNRYLKFTFGDIENMYDMYMSGVPISNIGDAYNISVDSVRNWFKKYGFKIKNNSLAHRQYEIDENYFDIIDTPRKAYYLGLLYADGNNMPEKREIRISLQECDKYILEKMKDDLNYSGPLRFIDYNTKNPNYKNQWTLDITNEHMSDSLESHGVCKCKSLILKWPDNLDRSLYSHFVRGYFDGDGCLYISKNHKINEVGFVGANSFLTKFIEIIREEIGVDFYIRDLDIKKYNPATKGARISNRNGIKLFLDWIYKDSDIMLERKYDKYQQFLNSINNSYCA